MDVALTFLSVIFFEAKMSRYILVVQDFIYDR